LKQWTYFESARVAGRDESNYVDGVTSERFLGVMRTRFQLRLDV
jgi:hypothetical protein